MTDMLQFDLEFVARVIIKKNDEDRTFIRAHIDPEFKINYEKKGDAHNVSTYKSCY